VLSIEPGRIGGADEELRSTLKGRGREEMI